MKTGFLRTGAPVVKCQFKLLDNKTIKKSPEYVRTGKGISLIIYSVLTPYFKDGQGQLCKRNINISPAGNVDWGNAEQHCIEIPG